MNLNSGLEKNDGSPGIQENARQPLRPHYWRTLLLYHAVLAIGVVILAVIQGNDIGLSVGQQVTVVIFAIVGIGGVCVWLPGVAFFVFMRIMRHPNKQER